MRRIALVLSAGAVAVGLAACGGGRTTNNGTVVDPIDVQAARACHQMQVFIAHATGGGTTSADGQAILDAAQPLLSGTAEAQAAGKPAPKWAELGADLVQTAADINSGDAQTISADGNKVADQCGTLSAAAKTAGGFTK
jgi:hypothetical protein